MFQRCFGCTKPACVKQYIFCKLQEPTWQWFLQVTAAFVFSYFHFIFGLNLLVEHLGIFSLHRDINSLDSFRVSTKSNGENWSSVFCHFHVKYLFGCVDADILSCFWTTSYCKLDLLSSWDTVSAVWYLSPLATWPFWIGVGIYIRENILIPVYEASLSREESNFKAQGKLRDIFSHFCLAILGNFP